jgi:hypothetical protein
LPSSAQNILSNANGNININNYQLSTTIDNTNGYFDFANNSTSTGNYTTVDTETIVQINVTNPTSSPVDATLNSEIAPAGFGFYMGNLAGNPTTSVTNGIPSVLDVNKTPESKSATFLDVDAPNVSGFYGLGMVAVTFTVATCADTVACAQRAAMSGIAGLTTIPDSEEEWSALLSLSVSGTPGGPFTSVLAPLDTSFPMPLTNFGLIAADDPDKAVGYSWDATPISVPIGTIAAGSTGYVSYFTTVQTQANYAQTSADNLLVAYAGFGDPIGKTAGGGGIGDPNFPLVQLDLPTFDPSTGALTAGMFDSYAPGGLPLTELDLAVPEPRGWALMIVGVGAVGYTLRRGASRLRRSRRTPPARPTPASIRTQASGSGTDCDPSRSRSRGVGGVVVP